MRLHEAAVLHGGDAAAIHWARVMEQATQHRLRERNAPAGAAERAAPAAWSKPVLTQVDDDFAGRLFELDPPSPRGNLPAG